MRKIFRTQTDNRGDYYSQATALDCNIEGNKDMARQEFKEEADINNILTRFGVHDQQRTMIHFGEADYTIDLQQAMHSVHDAQRAYSRMDPEIRKLYPSFDKFLRGMSSGDLAKDLERITEERKPQVETMEIRAQMSREKRRKDLELDEQAAAAAAAVKNGLVSPKVDEKAK